MAKLIRVVLLAVALLLPRPGEARDMLPSVRLEITSRITAFDGGTFGGYGPFERIAGVAHLRIDPAAPANRGIVDLTLAPRDADGLVAYDVDFVILRPAAGTRVRRVLLYDVVNRGMKLLSMFSGGNPMSRSDPIDPGDGLLLSQGWTMVWSGWQSDVAGPGLLGARFPVARRNGAPVTGEAEMETIFDSPTGNRMTLPYPAASLSRQGARLTVQQLVASPPVTIPPAHWRFEDERHIALDRPAGMDAGAIYRFTYTARDPVVMGLGFAATRDFVSWLRHASAADGNPLADIEAAPCERNSAGDCANPEGGVFSSAVAFGGSQSAGYLRDFLWQGFNADLAGRRVFDGVIPFVAGARETYTNVRFAQPSRFHHQHEDHDVPGFTFPFAYATLTDPVTGRRDGILRSCGETGTCPRVFHVDTSSEFWVAGASLVGTGGTGHDVDFPDDVRAHMIAGGSHAPGMSAPTCRYPANAMSYTPIVRALLLAMVDWTTGRKQPPATAWPRLDRGELVPLKDLKPPRAPSLGLAWPSVASAPVPPDGTAGWPVFVPRIDADGNDVPGIRMPAIAAPTGTYLGWNLRKQGFGEGDLCLVFGSYLPFARDAASRNGDTRLSLAERYPTADARSRLRQAAIEGLRKAGFLLDADAAALAKEAAPDH
jgi:hypothetical protein